GWSSPRRPMRRPYPTTTGAEPLRRPRRSGPPDSRTGPTRRPRIPSTTIPQVPAGRTPTSSWPFLPSLHHRAGPEPTPFILRFAQMWGRDWAVSSTTRVQQSGGRDALFEVLGRRESHGIEAGRASPAVSLGEERHDHRAEDDGRNSQEQGPCAPIRGL